MKSIHINEYKLKTDKQCSLKLWIMYLFTIIVPVMQIIAIKGLTAACMVMVYASKYDGNMHYSKNVVCLKRNICISVVTVTY